MQNTQALMKYLATFVLGFVISCDATASGDTFTPYQAGEVASNATDLWKDYDPRNEGLEIKVVKEWRDDGVVSRYVTFKVGTFKGSDARVAAFYSFPANGEKHPAFVWSHGGGQRAEPARGIYFAKQGFATVDINWLGRPMEPGIDANTDWGKVDPTQGPNFYPKALRKHWKRGFEPDAHTIDPVASPRNSNWFLLAVAGRRAITFLEQQPEVDAQRIGFSGYSMGGMITSLVATDARLKAVVPFVGGTGFLHEDFPGLEQTSLKRHYADHLDHYAKTMDPSAYWPRVKCPVMFISSTNDFHAAFDRIYQSMALLKHKNWRVSTNLHENHRPGPEQWVMLNLWFNKYLKDAEPTIPATPASVLTVEGRTATFTVTPESYNEQQPATEVYYSYDPNPLTRFWTRAKAEKGNAGKTWSARLAVHEGLPLYAFALCRYELDEPVQLRRGSTSTFSINSLEQAVVPNRVDISALARLPKTRAVFEDFRNGLQDWAVRGGSRLNTYLFQNPAIDLTDKLLALTIDPKGSKLLLNLRVSSKFLGGGRDLGDFSASVLVQGDGPQHVILQTKDFKGEKDKPLQWSRVGGFELSLVDHATRRPIDLSSKPGRAILQRIEMVDTPE